MCWITLEHSPAAYLADFLLYGALCLVLGVALILNSTLGQLPGLLLWALFGAAAWTLVEYGVHRFVLHGLPPFSRWHAEHHHRPGALIGAPTWLTASLFGGFAALPAWWLMGARPAAALTLGLVAGYLAYGVIHHATHGELPGLDRRGAWLTRRRRWHALHHARSHAIGERHSNFGVSAGWWDRVFGTCRAT